MKTSPQFSDKIYKVCIFDLDGTLINSIPTISHFCNKTLTHFGFTPIDEVKCQTLCRLPISEFYHQLLRLGGCPEEKVEELAPLARDYDIKVYLENPSDASYPYDGVPELLSELKERGVVLGVLTNKPHDIAQSVVNDILPGTFSAVTGQTTRSISKPDPRSLLNSITALGADKKDCLYVGDSDVDMKTAKAAEVDVAAVTWGFQSKEQLIQYKPEYTINTPAELLPLFGE